jgi:hypothetical protein
MQEEIDFRHTVVLVPGKTMRRRGDLSVLRHAQKSHLARGKTQCSFGWKKRIYLERKHGLRTPHLQLGTQISDMSQGYESGSDYTKMS